MIRFRYRHNRKERNQKNHESGHDFSQLAGQLNITQADGVGVAAAGVAAAGVACCCVAGTGGAVILKLVKSGLIV